MSNDHMYFFSTRHIEIVKRNTFENQRVGMVTLSLSLPCSKGRVSTLVKEVEKARIT